MSRLRLPIAAQEPLPALGLVELSQPAQLAELAACSKCSGDGYSRQNRGHYQHRSSSRLRAYQTQRLGCAVVRSRCGSLPFFAFARSPKATQETFARFCEAKVEPETI